MGLWRKFTKTIFYYCQGKGKPWRLILIWYFLLNIISLILGFCALASSTALTKTGWLVNDILAVVICLVFGFLGQIVTFIYPLIFVYALWKCAFNVKWEPLGFIIGFFTLPFLIAHSILGTLYFIGSIMMFYGALDIFKKW